MIAVASPAEFSVKLKKFTNLMFFFGTLQLLGKETGYFLGPDYTSSSTYKWWVDAFDSLANFFSLTLNSAGEATAITTDVVCPYELDVYWTFYVGVVFKSLWMLLCTGMFYYLFKALAMCRILSCFYHCLNRCGVCKS
eukprot:SAG31_NODE_26049_length_449_cov_1.211429_1_plen_137_part_01